MDTNRLIALVETVEDIPDCWFDSNEYVSSKQADNFFALNSESKIVNGDQFFVTACQVEDVLRDKAPHLVESFHQLMLYLEDRVVDAVDTAEANAEEADDKTYQRNNYREMADLGEYLQERYDELEGECAELEEENKDLREQLEMEERVSHRDSETFKVLKKTGACWEGIMFADGYSDPNEAWKACENPDWMDWFLQVVMLDGSSVKRSSDYEVFKVGYDKLIRFGGVTQKQKLEYIRECFPNVPDFSHLLK